MNQVPELPRQRMEREIKEMFEHVERERSEAVKKRKRAYLDGAAIGIALIAAIFTGWQAYEAHETRKEAAQLAQDTLRVSQRAYISVESVLNEKSLPVVHVRTFGNSPAVEVALDDINCSYQDTGERDDAGRGGSFSVGLGRVLAPGTIISQLCTPPGKEEKFALVHGTVTYKDVFGKRHLTEFCYVGQRQPNKIMEACSNGNSVD